MTKYIKSEKIYNLRFIDIFKDTGVGHPRGQG